MGREALAASLESLHERREVAARRLGWPHEDAEVGPPVGRHRRQQAPAHRLVVLAVVVAHDVERDLLLLLRVERGGVSALALVVERADEHPLAHVAEPIDARARPVEVPAPPSRVRLEQRRVDTDGRGLGGVVRHRVELLLDLRGVAPVPLGPELAQGDVRQRAAGRADLGVQAGQLGKAVGGVGAGLGRQQRQDEHRPRGAPGGRGYDGSRRLLSCPGTCVVKRGGRVHVDTRWPRALGPEDHAARGKQPSSRYCWAEHCSCRKGPR